MNSYYVKFKDGSYQTFNGKMALRHEDSNFIYIHSCNGTGDIIIINMTEIMFFQSQSNTFKEDKL